MLRILTTLLILVACFIPGYATHNRAGEITYRHISGYTFEFTITTYTYSRSAANRLELPIDWGDGESSIVQIEGGHVEIPGTDYYVNTYRARHTYPGPGVYQVLMEDPNRNQGVKNIPNSVNVIFSIKTTLLVGPTLGANSTPVLYNQPIDKAARGHVFIHNPAAYDPDGDSISYALTVCTGAAGEPIDNYTLPAYSDTLYMDEVRGDLIWQTPVEVGVYNIAILVEEWRQGTRIGRIARDMQIDVYETENNPPVNPPLQDICIVAGDTVAFNIHSTDADNDQMIQTMDGGPLEIEGGAVFEFDSSTYGSVYSHFEWNTDCSHARQQPYTLVLRTQDINDDIELTDITSFEIRVLHKAPAPPELNPGLDTIQLSWEPTTCGTAAGYKIYRSLGSVAYTPDSCETGVPQYTGYELIDYVTGHNTTTYTDDNNGQGLVPGYDYCYRITAYYSDGAESQASEETCTTLVAGSPPILQVSVEADDETNGEIEVKWAVPADLDSIYDGPYRYDIWRMTPVETELSKIAEIPSSDLTDTTFLDSGINTLIFPYSYSIRLFEQEEGVWREVPGHETATSQYLDIKGSDNAVTLNMLKRSPWLNKRYDVFRQELNSSVFTFIDTTNESVYMDTGLVNNIEYTYRTIGYGERPLYGTTYFVENTSHIGSGIPIDTIPPCPPDLFVTSECDSVFAFNHLSWTFDNDSCDDSEVIGFIVYSRDSLYGDYEVLDTLDPDIFELVDYPEGSIEKCYAVTAIDSFYNESEKLPFCVYNLCGLYELPNVFSPDGDGIHDVYVSFNLNDYVKRVDMTIFNRYGKEVFKTEDPDINWDGRATQTGKLVSTGVYYYICDVYEPRITGEMLRTLTGFIHVYSGDDNIRIE